MRTRASIESQKRQAIETQSRRAGQFAQSYDGLAQNPYHSCFTYSRHRLNLWLEHYLPPRGDGLRLLDLGCGTGHHMAQLRRRGFEVVGVDASKEMLEYARANNPGAAVLEADVEQLPLPGRGFDIVLCIEVLRHLPQSQHCIREMARVLKPGGFCLVTATPLFNLNGYALVNRIASRFRVGSLAGHRQSFHTTAGLRREFRDAGFARPHIHGVYLGPVNWVARLAPPVLPRFLRAWERIDTALTTTGWFDDFTNMVLVRGVRAG
jgi:ubiquinone/menaquinone biosynthesis C-methylase UbiE